jgi:hypothetical protein
LECPHKDLGTIFFMPQYLPCFMISETIICSAPRSSFLIPSVLVFFPQSSSQAVVTLRFSLTHTHLQLLSLEFSSGYFEYYYQPNQTLIHQFNTNNRHSWTLTFPVSMLRDEAALTLSDVYSENKVECY